MDIDRYEIVVEVLTCHGDKIRTERAFLPPAIEVWGKVIFSEACVKKSVHGGGLVTGGSGPGGGCLVETPPDGYCCRRYTSY